VTVKRRIWRGKRLAPRTPGEAWLAFAREAGFALVLVAGALAIALIAAGGDINLRPRIAWDYLWVKVALALILPLVLGYEIWLLWTRLASLRQGEVFVADDEVSPDAVPSASGRKRRETPAQARRRKAFWRETALVTAIWLFCIGIVSWVSLADWQAGRPLGQMGRLLAGLLVVYPVYVVLSVWLKNEKDRGR
jgi:hypothetical protein